MNISPSQLISALEWRYATKAFDPTRTIPCELWKDLERALVLSPSSFGLQPYQFLVITDKAIREKLVPHSWGQKQVVDCSHFVVFTSRTSVTPEYIDHFIQHTSQVRQLAPESLKAYRDLMVGTLVKGPGAAMVTEWAARQAYIALGNLMTSAALVGVDACPMEGIVAAQYDEILGLKGGLYKTAMACALGYRSATDNYARFPKVRLPESELIKRLS